MGNGAQDDPEGNTSSANPAGASSSVRLSGAIPGYSIEKVGVDSLTSGPIVEALWSGNTGQLVSLMPENPIDSVRGSFVEGKQFNPGAVCIQRIVSVGQGIGVINLTPYPKLHDLFKEKSDQVMLGLRDLGHSAHLELDLPQCYAAINQTPQDSCLAAGGKTILRGKTTKQQTGVQNTSYGADVVQSTSCYPTRSETSHGVVSMGCQKPNSSTAKASRGVQVSMGCHKPNSSTAKTSHGMVSMGCHKPKISVQETSHGLVSMGCQPPTCSICEKEQCSPLTNDQLLEFDKTILDLRNTLGVSMDQAITERFQCEVVALANWCIKQGDVISKSGEFLPDRIVPHDTTASIKQLLRIQLYVHVLTNHHLSRNWTLQKWSKPNYDKALSKSQVHLGLQTVWSFEKMAKLESLLIIANLTRSLFTTAISYQRYLSFMKL